MSYVIRLGVRHGERCQTVIEEERGGHMTVMIEQPIIGQKEKGKNNYCIIIYSPLYKPLCFSSVEKRENVRQDFLFFTTEIKESMQLELYMCI